MVSPISYGFLRPSQVTINPGPWTVVINGDHVHESPDSIPDWDYFTSLYLTRTIDVDLSRLLDDCRLDEASGVAAAITWHSSWTGLRGASAPVQIHAGANELSIQLDGEHLGGRLTVDFRILVTHAVPRHALAPHRPGSTLWNDVVRIMLEGTGSRFPVVPAPFEQTGIAGGRQGAWYLSLETGDLTASGSGSIRLYLNSSHPAVAQMVSEPSASQSVAFAEFIRYDVARQLAVQAMLNDELDDDHIYDPDSLGDMLVALLRRFFPDRDLRSLRTEYRTSPSELESELQARLGLMVT